MRVLMVTSATSGKYGAMVSMMTLVRTLEARGHEVEFVTWKGRGFTDDLIAAGRTVHPVRVRAKIDPFAIAAMARIIRERKIDVVHTHLSTSSVIGCLSAKRAKVPSVATVHGLSGKLSFVFADHLIAVSEATKAHLVAQGIPGERVSVVYNGIEFPTSAISKEEAQAKFGVAGCFPVSATTARVLKEKGAHVSIKAIALLKDEFPSIRHIFVGNGADTDEMRILAQSLGVSENIVFAGFQDDVWPALAACDVFLLPSLKEALGLSIVEAMAVGLPVVATKVGGIPEVLNSDCGVLVEPENASELAAGVRSALANPSFGENARNRAQQMFSAEAMAESTEHVYSGMRKSLPN